MPAITYTLYAPEASFRAFATLIAAEYNGIHIDVNTDLENASKSPVGKLPLLELPGNNNCGNNVIFSSHAMARFIAGLRRDTGLTGHTWAETAEIDAWMDWSAHDLELPATLWFYPVAGYIPFHAAAYEKAKKDVAAALAVLDAHLLDTTFLVKNMHHITLADIVIVSTLLYPFKLVADKTFLKPYTNVVRWFQTCVHQPEFVQVVGDVTLCKKELLAPGCSNSPSTTTTTTKNNNNAKKEKQPKKEKAKKDVEEAEEEPVVIAPPPEKKAEHPYKIMDKEAPSPFVMDVWKKTYSNCASYDDAMAAFWSMLDLDGWSLWHMQYNFPEECKRIFMTCNAVGGFQQRTDEIRKWAFGVQDVLGTEETGLYIKGVWLLRGNTDAHMKNANDDANWYTWTKLAGKDLPVTDAVKQQVYDYWTAETELEGLPIQDSKVFK